MKRWLDLFLDFPGDQESFVRFAVFHTTFMIQRNAPGGHDHITESSVGAYKGTEDKVQRSWKEDRGTATGPQSIWIPAALRGTDTGDVPGVAVSAVARIVDRNNDSVWRIFERYVDEARKHASLQYLKMFGIDEFFVERNHQYSASFWVMYRVYISGYGVISRMHP